jgi:hypothetical protein
MSMKLLLIATLCFAIHSGVNLQSKSSEQRVRRDLSAYDIAGPYSIDNEPPWEKRDRIAGEIRGFLWEHWRERRLGLVKATFFSIEGDHISSSFFVEPDAKGCWRITVESETMVSALLPKGRKPRREITREDYDKIDRVEPSGGETSLIAVPEDEVRQPQMYRLRLRNRSTNSVRIF